MTTSTPEPTGSRGVESYRVVWAVLMLLSSAIVGETAGLVAYSGGAKATDAILTAGGAFGGTLLVLLAIAHYVEPQAR